MHITYDARPIRCGDHELKPHVTFTQIKHERLVDGRTMTFAESPDITVRCETCGKESHTNRFAVDETFIERTWPQ